MSQVFDALRRSEAERAGVGEDTALAATDLLRRAERQAAHSKTGAEAAAESVDTLPGKARLLPFSEEAGGPAPELLESARPAEPSTSPGILSMFSTLSIAVTAESRLISLADKDSPAAEAFRLLAVRLRHLRKERPFKKLLITSTVPEEGKSFSSANLACALARNSQQKILLIEGDVRRPTLWQILGTAKMPPGVCEHVRDGRSLSSSIYRLEPAGIWFMPAGSTQGGSLEIVQPAKLNLAMDQLTQWFDWIIVDSPPVLPLADTTGLARLVDGIILVARRGTTKKRKLLKGLEALDPQKLIGVLLNSSDGASDNDYYYYHRDRAGSQQSMTAR